MHGIQVQTSSEPLRNTWSPDERSTAVKIVGGIGDALIIARVAAASGKPIALYVRKHQVSLIKYLVGEGVFVGKAIDLNSTAVQGQYGGLFDCQSVFVAGHREIRNKDYYCLTGDFLKTAAGALKRFPEEEHTKQKWVAIHAGASNPNRRIDEEVWLELASHYIQEGYKIKWLGTFGDFGYCNQDSDCLWSESSCLVKQTNILRQCELYFGNDSGFAHIAGILGIKGHVIFTNTVPEHVISRYPTLQAVECFKDIGQIPSRGLKVNDSCASACIEHLTPSRVFKKLGIELSGGMVQKGTIPMRELRCCGDLAGSEELVRMLVKAGYKLEVTEDVSDVSEYVDFGEQVVLFADGKPHRVSRQAHPEVVVRAFREILN